MDKYLNKIRSIVDNYGFERSYPLEEAAKPGYPADEAQEHAPVPDG